MGPIELGFRRVHERLRPEQCQDCLLHSLHRAWLCGRSGTARNYCLLLQQEDPHDHIRHSRHHIHHRLVFSLHAPDND